MENKPVYVMVSRTFRHYVRDADAVEAFVLHSEDEFFGTVFRG